MSSPQKAATRRPSSRATPSLAPVSTIAGVKMLRPGPPKKRARMVSVAGVPQARRHKGEAALEIVVGVLEKDVDPTVSSWIVHAAFGLSSSARSKKGVMRRRLGLGAAIAQGQEAHIARKIGRDEDAMVDRRDRRAVVTKVATPGP